MIRNAMPYSLKDAAEATGTSKPTILRAIQKGKISAAKDDNGEWQIEPSELHRVYPVVTERNGADETSWSDTQHSNLPYETGMLQGELEQLRERLATIDLDRDRERREASDQIADLRRRLDQSDQERRDKDRQLTALLTDQREKAAQPPMPAPPPQKSGFWGLFRRQG
jgi:excisionase family DNA binding protein